jgi:hypothetical protein
MWSRRSCCWTPEKRFKTDLNSGIYHLKTWSLQTTATFWYYHRRAVIIMNGYRLVLIFSELIKTYFKLSLHYFQPIQDLKKTSWDMAGRCLFACKSSTSQMTPDYKKAMIKFKQNTSWQWSISQQFKEFMSIYRDLYLDLS